jgi:hypothetical protein
LNEAVKRNWERFPEDFLFQLTLQERDALISQFAMSKPGRGGRRPLPYAFTEHGAIMAANVLNTPRAVSLYPPCRQSAAGVVVARCRRDAQVLSSCSLRISFVFSSCFQLAMTG